jgi:hypothetical protein
MHPGRTCSAGGKSFWRTWAAAVRKAPAEVAASLLLLVIRRGSAHITGPNPSVIVWRLREVLGRRRLAVRAADAAWAVRVAAALPDEWGSHAVMAAAAALA